MKLLTDEGPAPGSGPAGCSPAKLHCFGSDGCLNSSESEEHLRNVEPDGAQTEQVPGP